MCSTRMSFRSCAEPKAGVPTLRVTAWTKSVAEPDMFVSAYTIFELENGILRLERHDIFKAPFFEDGLKMSC